jgi:hypothetical protein
VGDIWGCKKLDYEYLKLGVYQKRQSSRL